MKIFYIFPSRSRKQKFFAALENIKTLSVNDNYEIIGVLDNDDPAMNNDEVRKLLLQYPNVRAYYGISTGKVNAINRELDKISSDADIICLHSDDMVFIKHGYDLDIIEAFEGFDGLVHFPDQKQKDTVTYSMISRSYLDVDGWIYHPDFISVYCDNYQQYVAQKRNKYKLVHKTILEHRHPTWGFGQKDELLKFTDSQEMYRRDKATFDRLVQTKAWL